MRKIIIKTIGLILFSVSFLFTPMDFFSQEVKRVGILLDGAWEENENVISQIKHEIDELLYGEVQIIFPVDKTIICDWDLKKMESSLNFLLEDPETDIIITAGEIVSYLAIFKDELNKPVIAPFAANASLRDVPLKDGASGVKNLNYISFTSSLKSQIPMLKRLTNFSKAALLLNELYFSELGDNKLGLTTALNLGGVELVPITVNRETKKPNSNIPEDVDAVISLPLFYLSKTDLSSLVSRLQSPERPFFSIFDTRTLYQGALAGTTPKEFFPRISRRIALNLQRILLGEEPGEIGVNFMVEDEFVINIEAAKELLIYPDWSVFNESIMINDDKEVIERKISLFDVLKEAIEANLDLYAKRLEVESGKQNVNRARSFLLPQLEVSATGLLLDKKMAENSFGQQAERTLAGSASFSQLIFSEKAWANLNISTLQQNILAHEREQLELDIILDASTAYLDLLRAKTFENIQVNNLNVSSSNLEMARFRENIGYAGASEVYRWESEIANNLKRVIEANANRNLVEINLNRLLNRPLEESFITEEEGIEIKTLIKIIADKRLDFYYKNKWHFKIFRKFIAEEALINSPEVKIINDAIEIQKRNLSSSTRSLYIPIISLRGEAQNTFYRGGAGSKIEPITIPSLGAFSFAQEPEDFTWNVALNFSLPLYWGGSRYADLEQSRLEITRLETELKSIKDKIDQQVRSALHLSGASYAGMEQAALSAKAAQRSLDLVSDAYQRGVLSIVDLIDAQNAVLVANEYTADAQFSFFIDLLKVQRSVGRYMFRFTTDQRHDFFNRLKEYFDKNIGR
ncbi:TolC family protein [Bacteroidota bacterium]